MKMHAPYPRVTSVRPLADKRLLVGFAGGVTKIYDCTPLLKHQPFRPLSDDAMFKLVRADRHGYGVVWTDELDLAESELWLNGKVAEPGDVADR
jgi:hypothetical protein